MQLAGTNSTDLSFFFFVRRQGNKRVPCGQLVKARESKIYAVVYARVCSAGRGGGDAPGINADQMALVLVRSVSVTKKSQRCLLSFPTRARHRDRRRCRRHHLGEQQFLLSMEMPTC